MRINKTILPLFCGWLLLFTAPAGAQERAPGTLAEGPDVRVAGAGAISPTAPSAGWRARDYGIPFDGHPGPFNAITDVAGVTVGQTTLISGDGPLVKGKGPVRTGVTAILPRGTTFDPVFANWYTLNGNGDMTGTHWLTESGFLETPILITNTGNVGTVRDAAWQWMDQHHYYTPFLYDYWYAYPVVAETYDGVFNDINGQHVHKEHVFHALDSAHSGPVEEGGVGGGTAMMCYGFTGGIGGNGSGDIFIAFSTATAHAFSNTDNRSVITLPNDRINPLFTATIEATEEAIINALFAGKTLVGINGNTVHAMPKEAVLRILKQYNRLNK